LEPKSGFESAEAAKTAVFCARQLLGLSPMPYFHFVARARWPHTPLIERDVCGELWERLQDRFGRCLGNVLMPNHLHLLLDENRPDPVRRALAIELRSLTRKHFPATQLWECVPHPVLIPDDAHLKRQIRYVHLNPCRSGLAKDPLEWEWSTHREAVGAGMPGWLELERLFRIWRLRPAEFAGVFHAYVSGDPSVNVAGTAAPSRPTKTYVASIDQIGKVACLALRAPFSDLRRRSDARRLAVRLAASLGLADRQSLCSEWGLSRERLWQLSRKEADSSDRERLQVAMQILADVRLQRVRGV
jgi:REP element-mobilizing transposase RayT